MISDVTKNNISKVVFEKLYVNLKIENQTRISNFESLTLPANLSAT